MAGFVVLPESTKSRLAQEMGQSLAQGLAKRFPKPEAETVRKQQIGALDEFKSLLGPNDSPADVSLKWAKATAGIPGAENLTSSILPQYQRMAAFNIYGGLQGEQPQQSESLDQMQQMAPSQVSLQQPPQSILSGSRGIPSNSMQAPTVQGQQSLGVESFASPVRKDVQQGTPSGIGMKPTQSFDPRILQKSAVLGVSPEEVYGLEAGLPQERVSTELTNQQAQRYQTLYNTAKSILPSDTTGEEVNKFIQLGKPFQNGDISEWARNTRERYQKYMNVRDSIKQTWVPGMEKRLFSSGPTREDAIKRINKTIQPLLDMGEEEIARSLLVERGLSPTETNSIIHPVRKELTKTIDKFPKIPEKVSIDPKSTLNSKVVDNISLFLEKNLQPDDSLLAIRDTFKGRNYDWEQFYTGLEKAMDSGLKLSAEQQGEMGALTAPPPSSLISIFGGKGSIIDYLRGAK